MAAAAAARRGDARIRVLFILNSLCVGGAEKHVVSLINRLDRSLSVIA